MTPEQVVAILANKQREHVADAAKYRREAASASPHDYERLTKVAAAHDTLAQHYARLVTEAKVQEAKRRTIRMGVG